MDQKPNFNENYGKGSTELQFQELLRNDALVATAMRNAQRSEASTVDALKIALVTVAAVKNGIIDRAIRLEAIAPRIVTVDGKSFRWDAPDEFVEKIQL